MITMSQLTRACGILGGYEHCCLLLLRPLRKHPCARRWAEPAIFTTALILICSLVVETKIMAIIQMRKPRLGEWL